MFNWLNNFLIKLGLKLPIELPLEYNIPLNQLSGKYEDTIHADISFLPEERIEIENAIKELNLFANNFFILNIKFDYPHFDVDLTTHQIVLIRINDQHPIILNYLDVEFKNKKVPTILGFCDCTVANNTKLLLVANKLLDNMLWWRVVAMHEIGHFLRMKHIEGNAIMNAVVYKVRTMTELDAIEFARVHKIDHNNLIYCLDK